MLGLKNFLRKNKNFPAKFKLRNLRKLTLKDWGKLFLKIFLGFIIFIALLFIWFSKDLPTPSKVKHLKQAASSQILDRNGNLLYAISGEKRRILLNSKDVPQNVKDATISLEDKNFYHHFGVNFSSIFRAVVNNILNRKSIQGGSTITQQLVKNTLLSPQRTFSRKIKEVILSIELEIFYSKEQILTMYLNEIGYGSNSYGIEAAARTYFGKTAKELTLAQAATLASIPQLPTYYSPYGAHTDKLFIRKNYALERMAALKYITKEEADKAKAEKITFIPKSENILAPHFVMYVREYLVDKYGEKMVEEGGLKVTTTLDPDKQRAAEQAVAAAVPKIKKSGGSNAALTAIDPKTGQVLAMVGSIDYFDVQNEGNVNVATSERQPGSAFKPVVYATGFQDKYNPAFILYDLKTDFGGGYSPDDYDGRNRGPVTVRQALAQSLNIPAVKMLGLVGINKVLDNAHKMGITSLNQPERYGLSLVLGGGEVKLVDLTTAYSVFANQGKLAPTTPILKIEDSSGKVLDEFKEDKKNVLDPQVAYQISSILIDNGARAPIFGSRSTLYFSDRQVAAKTGTTNNYRDAWTMGYTPSLAAGVWVGNNRNQPMDGAAGAMVAAPIFHQFMETALANTPNEQFSQPDGIQDVTVDKLSNKLPTQYSPETLTDIFAYWQVPKDYDDIHIRVKVNKINGKKATDLTPASLTEDRLYTNIHSEKPDYPNWEGPVLAWARAAGLENFPPKEEDDMYSSADKSPIVSITSPQNNANLTGNVEIKASASAAYQIGSVEFFIDNISIATDTISPYSVVYNMNNLSNGSHQIKAVATDHNGASSQNEITVNVAKSANAFSISAVSVTGTTSNSVKITWNTSKSATSLVLYDITSGNLQKSTGEGSMITSHTVMLISLMPNTTYYFKVKGTDALGNNAESAENSFKTSP